MVVAAQSEKEERIEGQQDEETYSRDVVDVCVEGCGGLEISSGSLHAHSLKDSVGIGTGEKHDEQAEKSAERSNKAVAPVVAHVGYKHYGSGCEHHRQHRGYVIGDGHRVGERLRKTRRPTLIIKVISQKTEPRQNHAKQSHQIADAFHPEFFAKFHFYKELMVSFIFSKTFSAVFSGNPAFTAKANKSCLLGVILSLIVVV